MTSNGNALPPAPDNVVLGSAVPVQARSHSITANGHVDSSLSQAPTLAASDSDDNEKISPSSSPRRNKHAGDAVVDMPREKSATYDEKTGQPIRQYDDDEEHGIDVERSKAQFHELSRQLSQASELHRTRTRQSIAQSASLAERGEKEEEEEEFDLTQTIKGGNEARDQQGFKPKHVGVVWDGLNVQGAGGLKIHIRTFPNAIMEQFLMPLLTVGKLFGFDPFGGKPRTLLNNFNGLLRPGEMCLVLGRPNSGCSTFLKAITNKRESYISVGGDVVYQGIGWKEMAKTFPGEVVYNMEDDVHLPTLTVQQTLEFALSTKTPRKMLEGVTPADFRKRVLDVLLKMLNISHTRNTMVGNEFVRGVSGGERKRVSIAEMFCARATVCAWDNSTRGLDASTALDYAKSLRILTDIQKMTTFVTLYQAGEGIFEQFDKVLVIDNGRQVYFGPAKDARPYFLGLGFRDLPRQTSADYLTGCTDPNERQFADGRSPENVPSTPEALEAAYLSSDVYKQVEAERTAYLQEMEQDKTKQEQFRQAIAEDKRKSVGKKSPYTVGFGTQVLALTKRQLQLAAQDKFGIYTGFFTSIAIALITGSCFYALPATASGAFTRGGALFIAMLFNALNAFSELPTQMMGRPIMYKQVGYRFYRPGALAIAQTVADFPINAVKIFCFSIIIYFMVGLASNGGAFFTFYLFVMSSYIVMSAFFRVLGTATQSYDVAARLASVLISFMVIYAGYMIPVFTMKRWLFWIYYINPLSYGFESLMVNEFMRIELQCDTAYITPHNVGPLTSYPATIQNDNQVCTLAGATAGSNAVPGIAYVQAGFQYSKGHLWRNFGILVGFFIAFAVMQVIAMEYLAKGAAAVKAIVVFAKENKDTKERNARLAERKAALQAGELEQNLAGLVESKRPFTWEGLNYTVPVPGGHRQLLNEVYGYVRPGTLTALMGASGAGKTTLLDVLAARKTIGVIGGDILINGRKPDVTFQKGTAYVEQADVHEWTTTVREAMRYSAYLRQPAHVSKAEKDDYVEEILELLELQDLADAMIGFPGYGLSVEARKRLTIGVELAAKPELLLFLDEPTSGLDGQSAYNIVRFLRKLAAAGQAILCTIHQPNALLFENFDRLLLLQRGGECVYFGDVGKDSHVLVQYLERGGAPVPSDANPAEFMLEAIGAGSSKRMGDEDWGVKWRNSPELAKVKEEIKALNEEALKHPDEKSKAALRQYSTSFAFQFWTILKRTNIALWRNADYQWTRLFSHMAIALITSLTFLQLNDSARSLQYRVFAIFIVTVLPALVLAQIEPQYIMSRNTYVREASSKMYSATVFALCQMLAEMPYSVLCAVGFYLLWYFPIGFQYEPSRAGFAFAMVLITEVYSVTLGQAVAALSPSIIVAALFNPFLLVIFSLFCGVTIPSPNLTYFWRAWMYPLDPFTRLVSGLVSTALHGLPVVCTSDEFQTFTAPAGQTCRQWAGEYADLVGGYLNNPDSTSVCEFCQYRVGDTFLAAVNISFSDRGRDLGIFICYVVFNILVTLLAARFLSYAKR